MNAPIQPDPQTHMVGPLPKRAPSGRTRIGRAWWLAAFVVLTTAAAAACFHLITARTVKTQFTYTTGNGSITITGYTGTAITVEIPGRINGLPVTSIGNTAFQSCTNLTSVTIPRSVTNIDRGAFSGCTNLTGIRVDEHNSAYSDVDGVLFNKRQSALIQYPPGRIEYGGLASHATPDAAGTEGEALSNTTSQTSGPLPLSVTPFSCDTSTVARAQDRVLTNATDIGDAMVKIYAVMTHPDYLSPWNTGIIESGTGSGCLMKQGKILTSAHVVGDGTFIEVRRHGQSRRYEAQIESVSHEADLAVLTVADPDFFEGARCLELGSLPEPQQEVLVYGFPMGGDSMSITKGVVSRVEHQTYVYSGQSLLAIQIDAALNPGNSGGPAIVNGRIAGVAMMGMPNANNIGYIVPVSIIRHVLDDMAAGHPAEFPSMGILLESMESPDLKRRYRIPANHEGALVTKILRGSSAGGILRTGDVITRLDDMPVASDLTVAFHKGERTSLALVVQQHHLGETMKVGFLRDGQPLFAQLTLTNSMKDDVLVPLAHARDTATYYQWGGLTFCPLTTDLLKAWGSNWQNEAPKRLVALLDENTKDDQIDEIVILLRVEASDLTRGYQDVANVVVRKVNGKPIGNLQDLISTVESATTPFVEFEDRNGNQVVLDRERVQQQQFDVQPTNGIAEGQSSDLLPSTRQAVTTPVQLRP